MSAQYARNVSTSLNPNPTLVKELCRLLSLFPSYSLSTLPGRVSPTFRDGLLLKVLWWDRGEDTTKVTGCALLSSTDCKTSSS